jgi:hypothetical protein
VSGLGSLLGRARLDGPPRRRLLERGGDGGEDGGGGGVRGGVGGKCKLAYESTNGYGEHTGDPLSCLLDLGGASGGDEGGDGGYFRLASNTAIRFHVKCIQDWGQDHRDPESLAQGREVENYRASRSTRCSC